jgi:3D-(3,5/4)-trihydroxycyclohexane-1,2-dione acylhydrolase (decyclizing)
MATIRLTAAEATVRFLAAQMTEVEGRTVPLFGGVLAIFGHGNVAGLGAALDAHREVLPTWRGHNEQAMAHAAIAYRQGPCAPAEGDGRARPPSGRGRRTW